MKRMNDDDVMNYVYGKMFGDLDGIEAGTLFDDEDPIQKNAPNAEPQSKGSGGVKITVEPVMAGVAETSKLSAGDEDQEEEEDKRLNGISRMSPLMAQLHPER